MKKIINPLLVFVFLFLVPSLVPNSIRSAIMISLYLNSGIVSILGIGLFLFGVFWIDKVNKLFIKRDYELGSKGYPFIIVGFSTWFVSGSFGDLHFIALLWTVVILVCAISWLFVSYMKNFSDFASKDFVTNERTNLYCLVGSVTFLFIVNLYIIIT